MQNEEKIMVRDDTVDIIEADTLVDNNADADKTAKSGIKIEGVNVGVGNINDSKGKNAEISGFKGDINFGNVVEEKSAVPNKQRFADAANMQVPDTKQADSTELVR